MLDDDGRLGTRHDLLDAVERSQRLGAIGVERGHAVSVIVFAEVHEIAAEQHVSRLRQLDQETVMAGRVPRRIQHDHAAIAEHILVERNGLDLALAFDPICERRGGRVFRAGGKATSNSLFISYRAVLGC